MALISGLYVFVLEETVDSPVTASQHPVESGGLITDNVRPDARALEITGQVLGKNWAQRVSALTQWQRKGLLVDYIGESIFRVAQITSFRYKTSSRIDDGCEFTMKLQEVRLAANLFVETYTGGDVASAGATRVLALSEPRLRYHTMVVGESLYYIATQYRQFGVTVDALYWNNRNRPIFYRGGEANFDYVLPGAQLLLGRW